MASIAYSHTMASQAWAHGRYRGLCWGRMGPWARLQHLYYQWRHNGLESKSWTWQGWLQRQLSDLTHLRSEFHLRTCRHNDQHGISHVSNRHNYSFQEEMLTQQPTVAIDIATSSIVVVIVAPMAAIAFATSMAAMPAELLLLMPASTGAAAVAATVATVPVIATKATASFLVAPVA